MSDRLDTYRNMRDFERTPEPEGEPAVAPDGLPRFVIQEHHATALHWDFRLERDGVLVSWAVPKGLPVDKSVNNLAVHTEDHPLSYYDFEGEIPKGEYGGGRVILWDQGTYETEKFRDSEVIVTLHGKRARGKYVLFQTEGKNWMVHRMDPPEDPEREPMPEQVVPMLAKLSGLPKDDANHAFEVKWDGIRAIAYVQGGRVRLQSRNLLDITKQYPELAELGEELGLTEVVLDGEIVAPDADGVPRFERLQQRMNLAKPNDIRRRVADTPVVYMIFDLLYLDGRSTMQLPYTERRRLLEGLALTGPCWQTPPYHAGDGPAMLEASKAGGLEGVVAKRLDSPYEAGRRSTAWLKVKNSLRQEFVIGGWTPGAGNREDAFGALLLGYYDSTPSQAEAAGREQRFIFAGKVGTGFDDRLLRKLMAELKRGQRATSPFDAGEPESGSCFVEPELVAEVDFTEWTEAGTLRHPSFKGLRNDKPPRMIVREGTEPMDEPPVVVGRPGVGARAARGAGKRPAGPKTKGQRVEVEVEGRRLVLSNLDKEMYAGTGFTKARVIDYYTRIAPVMVPHVAQRPMTLKRYPDGAQGPHFYEKQCPSHAPTWVEKARVGTNSDVINYCLVNDLPTLAWLANLAALELHPLLARAPEVLQPTMVVFDLDPGPPANIIDCAQVAIWLRELFETLGLQSFPKTSGSKGMQIYVPLNRPVTYDETKPFAQAIAMLMERQHPDRVVSSMTKSLRTGKVFIDWSQNDDHKSTIAVYSLRARERPTVSTPVTWDEVARAIELGDPGLLSFESDDVLRRVEELGDLFAPVETLEQELPRLG
ncbi:MAG: DNA ligase D [Dehalococcoidia bacterium]|nr:DNA ligase D [Dehalococcoidia bacterium]